MLIMPKNAKKPQKNTIHDAYHSAIANIKLRALAKKYQMLYKNLYYY